MTVLLFPLKDMAVRHRGLTPAVAASYEEAAAVCLSRHGDPPCEISIEDAGATLVARAEWSLPDGRQLGAWANIIDATEAGAYAMVLGAAELGRGYLAVRRAETGTGADYYVGPQGAGEEDLEDCLRLEVSGMDDGGIQDLRRRLAAKVQQANNGSSSLPALAGVICFSIHYIILTDVS
jgi:hypothetical protein